MNNKEWLLAVGYSFNPIHYKKIADAPPREMFHLVHKTLKSAFLVMLLIAIPTLMAIPGQVSEMLGQFDSLNLTGDVELQGQVGFPLENPQLVIDLSSDKGYDGERALITKKYFYFRTPLKPQKISLEYFKDPISHKKESSLIIFALFLMWLPSLLIYAYLVTFLKYAIWISIASLVSIVVIRAIILSPMRLRRILNICAYALIPIILLEVLLIPFDTSLLFPILDFMGFSINAGTIVIYLILLVTGIIGLEKEIRFEVRDKPRERHHAF